MNPKVLILTILLFNVSKSAEIEVKASFNEETGVLTYGGKSYYSYLHEEEKGADATFWINISIIAFFTCFAGAMSGLTVGYLSIDDLVLELKSKTGSDAEQKLANKILPIISRRHWLLVTLLLWNATAMEALPIFLNRIVDEYMAICISVSLVLFIGEIIPQALCTGPSQLKIASCLAPLVTFLMYISYPISYPIALILDYLVGKHSKSRFVNTDLKGLIELHTHEALERLRKEEGHHHEQHSKNEIGLHTEQADLMISALKIKERKAYELMIPLEKVYMLDCDQTLDTMQVQLILEKGYSRIPVFCGDKSNIMGILRIKQLIGLDFSQGKSLSQLGLKLSPPLVIKPDTPALELLREFRAGKSHMAFITSDVEQFQKRIDESTDKRLTVSNLMIKKAKHTGLKVLGLITLEDVLENMINIEILDEDDYARNLLPEKGGQKAKTQFYKNAITKEIARSFMEENREKLNIIIENSFKQSPMLEKTKSNLDDFSYKLKEPLL